MFNSTFILFYKNECVSQFMIVCLLCSNMGSIGEELRGTESTHDACAKWG